MQLILEFNFGAETTPEVDEVIQHIKEKKIKMAELWEIGQAVNREFYDISIEVDELVNKYSQLVITKPLWSKTI